METLTPQDEQLNVQLCKLPVIKELQSQDAEIIEDLESLKDGQVAIDKKVDDGFAKGKERMDGLENMFKNHISRTEEMHKENQNAYNDLKAEIKDNKFKDVTQELKEKNAEIQAIKDKFWGAVKMVMNTVLSIIAGGLVIYLFK